MSDKVILNLIIGKRKRISASLQYALEYYIKGYSAKTKPLILELLMCSVGYLVEQDDGLSCHLSWGHRNINGNLLCYLYCALSAPASSSYEHGKFHAKCR